VIGGGAIGLEIGRATGRFGTHITVVEMAERLVGAEEPEASALIKEVLRREGVEIHMGVRIARIEAFGATGATVHLYGGPDVSAERMLVATGHRSDLAALGVGALGLDESARALPVDANLRVAPGVWAVGDVTERARSPTLRCTRRGSAPPTSSDSRTPRPTATRCRA
jgi:pyruvate/2-oxoglutarate dehydrogenase complex dihydrolipoamide dehydrogenase (E3) component